MAKDAEKLAAQAQRISELRAAKRVTQPDVAEAVGVTLRAYQAWEAGDSGLGAQNIKKLAGYFETTPDFIEYGEARARAAAPALMDRLGGDQTYVELVDRLDRIEESLEEVIGLLTDQPDARANLHDTVARIMEEALLRQGEKVGRRGRRPPPRPRDEEQRPAA